MLDSVWWSDAPSSTIRPSVHFTPAPIILPVCSPDVHLPTPKVHLSFFSPPTRCLSTSSCICTGYVPVVTEAVKTQHFHYLILDSNYSNLLYTQFFPPKNIYFSSCMYFCFVFVGLMHALCYLFLSDWCQQQKTSFGKVMSITNIKQITCKIDNSLFTLQTQKTRSIHALPNHNTLTRCLLKVFVSSIITELVVKMITIECSLR